MPGTIIHPKQPVRVAATLFGGKKIVGEFFLTTRSSRHAGPETLLELLNDNTRSFVPFHLGTGTTLLNRGSVRSVDFDTPELLDIFVKSDSEFIYSLQITFRTETKEMALQGFCFTGELPAGNRRPADLLNSPDLFMLFYCDGNLMLLNKNAISHANVE